MFNITQPVFAAEFKRQIFHLPVNKQRRMGALLQKGEESMRRYQILAYKVSCRDEKRPRPAAAGGGKKGKRHLVPATQCTAYRRSNAKLLVLTLQVRVEVEICHFYNVRGKRGLLWLSLSTSARLFIATSNTIK